MKRLGRWVVWILILEFLFFFVVGLRLRRELEQPRLHFVQAEGNRLCDPLGAREPCSAWGPGIPFGEPSEA